MKPNEKSIELNAIHEILLFSLSYSVIQGLLLSVWLFFYRKQIIFGLFFLNISYLIFIFVYEARGWTEMAPHLIWTNVPSWFLIAPLLFLFSKYTLEPVKSIKISDALHFIPALLVCVYFFSFYVENAAAKLTIYNSFYNKDTIVDYIQMLYITQMLLYAYFGRKFVNNRVAEITGSSSNSTIVSVLVVPKIFSVLTVYVIISLANALIYGLVEEASISYYTIAFFVLSSSIIIATIYFLNTSFEGIPEELSRISLDQEKGVTVSYKTSSLSASDLTKIAESISSAMKEKELFKNPDLNLKQFARECEIPAHHITQCLNQQLNKTFFQFVNEYRVEAVRNAFHQNQQNSMTLLAIAQDCGFKSQSSFYRIIKSETGMTPGKLAKSKL